MPRDGASWRPNPPAPQAMTQTPQEIPYGPIEASPEYLQQLRRMIHHHGELKKAGYILQQLSSADLERKKRCERCCRVLWKGNQKSKPGATLPRTPTVSELRGEQSAPTPAPAVEADSVFIDLRPSTPIVKTTKNEPVHFWDYLTFGEEEESPPKLIVRCKFHPGRVASKRWTCCNSHIMSKPCTGESFHSPLAYSPNSHETNWHFHKTPSFAYASSALAVALDCEMGTAQSGESELIRLSVIDYFSRAVLLDSLVYPDVQMAHYNTRFSGVTRQAMNDAKRRGKCLLGREGTRQALWKIVGKDTVVIGHSGVNDLTCLRWIHPSVVDTLLLETAFQPRRIQQTDEAESGNLIDKPNSEKESGENTEADTPAVSKGPGLSLKALSLERLGRTIQVKGRGHDSLEDALATRDLLHWHVERLLA